MGLGSRSAKTRHSAFKAGGFRLLIGVSAIVLALGLSHISLASDLVVPEDPATQPLIPGTTSPQQTSQSANADALNVITQAVGGNSQTAAALVQALGGDAVAALNAINNGTAGSMLSSVLGSGNALSFLTGALGSGDALSAMMGALGQTGSLNALIGSLGGQGALNSLVGGLLGNNAAIASLQSLLGGNMAGLNALSSLLGGDMSALSSLTNALGGMDGALSALTGALGVDNALSALTGALGMDGALAALTNVLGIDGALAALTNMLGQEIAGLIGVNGLCGIAPLTGTFAVPACRETKDQRSISYAKQKQGGGKVAEKISETMNDRLEPALKDQAAQLHAGTIDQTRILGSVNDAAGAAEAARDIDGAELESKQALQPHDQTCALPSTGPAIATTAQSAAAITRGLTNDAIAAANPVEGTVAESGPAAVFAARYNEYCNLFVDPSSNNGAPGCENITPLHPTDTGAGPTTETGTEETADDAGTGGSETPPAETPPAETPPADADGEDADDAEPAEDAEGASSLLPNGDIDVENILLSDTLDLENQHYRIASQAILRNLVAPKSYPPLPDGAEDTAEGKEWIVRKERIDTLRRIASDVVASMIARRTSVEIPDPVAAGWIIPPASLGPTGAGFSGECFLPNAEGDANARIYNTAMSYYNNGTRSPLAPYHYAGYCQRFVREVSRRFGYERFESQAASLHAELRRSEGRNIRGSTVHAVTAWAGYRRVGMATPCGADKQACVSQMRPGDLVYMASTTENGLIYGHTGIYAGNTNFISGWNRSQNPRNGVVIMSFFGPRGYETRNGGELWGFVRPSGVSTTPQDCGVPTPGRPETLAEGESATPAPPSGAPTPPPAEGTPPTSPPQTPAAPGGVTATGSYNDMLETLGRRESGGDYSSIGGSSGNYMGKYQMGVGALIQVGCVHNNAPRHSAPWTINYGYSTPVYSNYRWTQRDTCPGVTNHTQFIGNRQMQDRTVRVHNEDLIRQMRAKDLERFQCSTVAGQLVTPSGMICAAHLVGAGGLSQWLKSGGTAEASDTFGTKAQEYLEMCKNYDSPWGGACDGSRPMTSEYSTYTYDPPPPRPVKEIVREIRERAGIPPHEIAEDPSYNEIMLALTKERFFDPRYFADMASSMGAMQQNETSLNAYISMTLRDIYLLQEQINALAAAKASLRIERDGAATNND